MKIPRFAASLLLSAVFVINAPCFADSSVTHERTVTQVAAGIYAIRHADGPDGNPQGNTTVIIGERAVMVVDSSYLPSSAREDIAQIRTWTDKPVTWLLNTHWHPDHVRGNVEYRKAFPTISIVAQDETLTLGRNYEGGNLERRPARLAAMRDRLKSGKGPDGKRLSSAELAELRETLAGSEIVDKELHGDFRQELPDVTFDTDLNVDLGGRMVQIRHSGTGDTLGDAWVYLPAEKVLVTGDVLVHPVPYFFAGYPSGLLRTLRQFEQMDVNEIVPGHGAVLRDKVYLRSEIALVDSMITQVNAEIVREGSLSAQLEKVRATIDTATYRKQFAGDDTDSQLYFDESIEGLIADAFYQAPK